MADAPVNFEQFATMRRYFSMLQLEISEHFVASVADNREAMAQARLMAHEHLDAYFDAVYAAGMVNHVK